MRGDEHGTHCGAVTTLHPVLMLAGPFSSQGWVPGYQGVVSHGELVKTGG